MAKFPAFRLPTRRPTEHIEVCPLTAAEAKLPRQCDGRPAKGPRTARLPGRTTLPKVEVPPATAVEAAGAAEVQSHCKTIRLQDHLVVSKQACGLDFIKRGATPASRMPIGCVTRHAVELPSLFSGPSEPG